MQFWTSPLAIGARSVARTLGLNPLIHRLISRDGYEAAFDEDMMAAITVGGCVWDIGANVGLYTVKFAAAVGEGGKVFAFEPSPVNLPRLKAATAEFATISIVPFALGSAAGTVSFTEGEDDLGAVSRVTIGAAQSGLAVEVRTGDALVADGIADVPTMIKLDVEGFELEVLKGMSQTLRNPKLTALCVEVHFGLLSARGASQGPREIEKLLTACGFSVKWTDPSHIVARRAA